MSWCWRFCYIFSDVNKFRISVSNEFCTQKYIFAPKAAISVIVDKVHPCNPVSEKYACIIKFAVVALSG